MRNLFYIIIAAWLGVAVFTVNAAPAVLVNRSRQLGVMAFKKADYRQAVDFFQQYMNEVGDDNRKLADAYECLIATYIRNGDIKIAGETLDNFEQRLAGISLLRKKLFRADILLLEKKYRQAADLYEAVLATSIVEGELYFQLLSGLAFSQGKQEKWSRAAETYAILENAGKDSGWQLESRQLGIEALIMDGQLAAGEALLKKVEAQNSSMATVRLKLLLLIKQKKYAEFIRVYRTVVKKIKLQQNASMYDLNNRAAKYFLIANDIAGATMLLNDAWHFAPTGFDRKKTMRILINTYVRGDQKAKAVKVAEKYIEFYKDAADVVEVRFQLARLLHEMNKSDDAEMVYQNLMSDKAVPLKSRLAAARELAVLFSSDKRYDLAEQALDFIYQHGTGDTDRYEGRFMTGKLYMLQGKYSEATILFKDIAKQSPVWRDRAIFQQIECLSVTKHYQEALKLAESALTDSKDSATLKHIAYNRAFILERLGRLKDARNSYLDFVRKYPGSENAPTALFAAAEIAYNGRNFAMAAELFADFVRKYRDNPQAPSAIYKRLYANYFGGIDEAALKDADLLLKNYPKSKYTIAALFWKVDWLREHRKFSEAVTLLKLLQEKYKQDGQTSAQVLYELATINGVTGKLDQAIEQLKIIFNKYTDSSVVSEAYLLAGDTLSRSGKYAEAIEYYSRGARLRPDSTLEISCRGRLGDCNFVLFNKTADEKYLDNAIAEYNALLKLKSLTPAMRGQTIFKLGRSYELQDNNDQALKCYKEVILGYQLDLKNAPELGPIWAVKSAYAAIVIYLKEGTPEAASKAIDIYKTLQEMNIKTGEDFSRLIVEIENKYKL
ncbi:MAG: tetratricopeptide repeat protein [Victivallaceae bacterium]|nr:tetratricopeptide repeat protein [Victivallaceae bacterium]